MSKIKTMNATLLIMGTSIGAGMLGLPVEAGRGGFLLSLLFLVSNWLTMMITALLLVELLTQFKHNANFISLSEKILGTQFEIATFVVYIALFISLTLAYIKGGGIFISDYFTHIPVPISCFIFLVCLVPLIILGSKFVGYGNAILTIILMISFITLISLGTTKINFSLLNHFDWKRGYSAYSMFITSFAFQGVLPSLTTYVGNKRSLRISIVIGTFITFCVYLIWLVFVMGIVPLEGVNSLTSALSHDETAISPLKYYLESPLLTICARVFYFTAITTSFLGVGLGLIDFLLDSFKMKRSRLNRFFLAMLIYLPALWITTTNLRIFYLSLKYGGGLACLYLLIILPIIFYIKRPVTTA